MSAVAWGGLCTSSQRVDVDVSRAVRAQERRQRLMIPAVAFSLHGIAGSEVTDIRHAVTLDRLLPRLVRLADNREYATTKIGSSVFPDDHSAGWFRPRRQSIVGDRVPGQ